MGIGLPHSEQYFQAVCCFGFVVVFPRLLYVSACCGIWEIGRRTNLTGAQIERFLKKRKIGRLGTPWGRCEDIKEPPRGTHGKQKTFQWPDQDRPSPPKKIKILRKTKKWLQDRWCWFWPHFCRNRKWNQDSSVRFCRIFPGAFRRSLSWRESFSQRFEGILFLSLIKGRV